MEKTPLVVGLLFSLFFSLALVSIHLLNDPQSFMGLLKRILK
jgi:hypothetical protein